MNYYNHTPLACAANGAGAAVAKTPIDSDRGGRDNLSREFMKALLKADKQGKAMNAYVAEHTLPEDAVAEDEPPYPINAFV